MIFRKYTEEEINNALTEMERNKVAGPDDMLEEMMVETGNYLKRELAKLFNSCFETK